jgi:predicted ATPase
VGDRFARLRTRLAEAGDAVRWLSAVRLPVETPGHTRADIGPNGENVAELLATDWARDRALFKRINPFYAEMFGEELCMDGDRLAVQAIDGPPVPVPIAHTGEGASQALAVFVLGAMAEAGKLGPAPVVVIEQPEMHLHPAAENTLAQFLVDVARSDVRLVLETHSENLLLFVQLAVATGKLRPEQVQMYFVRRMTGGGGSVADPIALDDLGRPDNWPAGVFSEDVKTARDLLLARRGKVHES